LRRPLCAQADGDAGTELIVDDDLTTSRNIGCPDHREPIPVGQTEASKLPDQMRVADLVG